MGGQETWAQRAAWPQAGLDSLVTWDPPTTAWCFVARGRCSRRLQLQQCNSSTGQSDSQHAVCPSGLACMRLIFKIDLLESASSFWKGCGDIITEPGRDGQSKEPGWMAQPSPAVAKRRGIQDIRQSHIKEQEPSFLGATGATRSDGLLTVSPSTPPFRWAFWGSAHFWTAEEWQR